ncbi:hypothetical protein ABZ192_34905 [Streptomyces sp. NPDC006235]|uniref:hypothetical protein n=1 Tax=Streptomyces sp. NPDC006235 TaxID=3156736 RepID=UPI0033AC6136
MRSMRSKRRTRSAGQPAPGVCRTISAALAQTDPARDGEEGLGVGGQCVRAFPGAAPALQVTGRADDGPVRLGPVPVRAVPAVPHVEVRLQPRLLPGGDVLAYGVQPGLGDEDAGVGEGGVGGQGRAVGRSVRVDRSARGGEEGERGEQERCRTSSSRCPHGRWLRAVVPALEAA